MLLNEKERQQKLIIYGAGTISKAFILALEEEYGLKNINLVGCMVSQISVNVSDVDGVRVYQIDDLAKDNSDACVLLAVREMYVDDIVMNLKKYNFTNFRMITFSDCIQSLETKWKRSSGKRAEIFVEHLCRDELTDEEYIMFLSKQLKNDKLSFEVNFADHCNLNCQCCNHFSPLAKEQYINKEQYKKDLKRLQELFGERIGRVMLLGGEPLLNQDIVSLLYLSRQYLPTAALHIFTNGLHFPQMTEKFWRACRENNINIKVTEYPIKFDYKYWFDFARQHGVDIANENPEAIKTTYRLPFVEKGGLDPYKNYIKCYHANQCIVLREGRLYTCPIAAWNSYLNEYFDKQFPELEQNSIDIHKATDAETIMEFLKNPIKMCEFCDIYNYEYNIPWHVSRKDEESG